MIQAETVEQGCPEVCVRSLALDPILDEGKKAAIEQKSSGTWMNERKEMERADKRTEKLTKSEQKDLYAKL